MTETIPKSFTRGQLEDQVGRLDKRDRLSMIHSLFGSVGPVDWHQVSETVARQAYAWSQQVLREQGREVPWTLRRTPGGYHLGMKGSARVVALLEGRRGNWRFRLYSEGGELGTPDPRRFARRTEAADAAWNDATT